MNTCFLNPKSGCCLLPTKGVSRINRYFPPLGTSCSCGRDGYFRTSGADSVQGEVAAQIPAEALAENTLYHRQLLTEPPEYARKAWEWTSDCLPPCTSAGIEIHRKYTWNDILLTLLDTPTIASKRWVYRQYDHQVQNNTVILPGDADAAVIRLRPVDPPSEGIARGVAATVDCNPRYVYLNPMKGLKQ